MKSYLVFMSAIMLLSFANLAKAGDIYSCQMKRFIFLENEEVTDDALDEFSFEVMQDAVQFGEGGLFDDANEMASTWRTMWNSKENRWKLPVSILKQLKPRQLQRGSKKNNTLSLQNKKKYTKKKYIIKIMKYIRSQKSYRKNNKKTKLRRSRKMKRNFKGGANSVKLTYNLVHKQVQEGNQFMLVIKIGKEQLDLPFTVKLTKFTFVNSNSDKLINYFFEFEGKNNKYDFESTQFLLRQNIEAKIREIHQGMDIEKDINLMPLSKKRELPPDLNDYNDDDFNPKA